MAISADPAFTDLVEKSILSAEPDRGGKGWRLRAGPYVGRATLGRIPVEIVEKVEGGFDAMAAVLAPSASRLALAPSPIKGSVEPDRAIGLMMVDAARAYLSRCPDALYEVEHLQGSLVTGSIEMRATIGLRARGMRHKLAFCRSTLTDDTTLNHAVHAALGCLSTFGAATSLGSDVSIPARTLLEVFGKSATGYLASSMDELLNAADEAANSNDSLVERREAGALAYAVLSGASLARFEVSSSQTARSFFVNLETVFERYVETLVRAELGTGAQVGNSKSWPGRSAAPPLFDKVTKRYLSNPDVVIVNKSGETILIDAKYKELKVAPDTSDVYQLLAHAAACGAKKAALFYPSEISKPAKFLGTSATDCQVWTAFISFTGLEGCNSGESVREALGSMGESRPSTT